MRISDADRSRAVEELRRHCRAGRLDLDAYAERVAEAMEAETLADLDHALRDLPTLRIADPAADPPVFARARRGDGAGPFRDADQPGFATRRFMVLRARLVVLLTVLVVALGAGFLVLAHWVWALVLVVGWLVGVLQGRIRVGGRHQT